ncbi:hypothetical protein TrLO_g9262 [Triparma laevis f. longispina]|uniref:Amino acid transporter transmembrane domain-containing protein n=1 Tax=Triparma laevis f. longispina TaxID=1714387 RepID=A0A9W7KYF0_9STRA|nr:hypothetical protein TrLO_g9262 [Triparma laevis f. longispina]
MRSATSSMSSGRSDSLFSTPFNSASRTGTISSAVFNLTTTMVGGGVLSLPYAFSKSGLLTGYLLLLLFACVSDFTVYSLVSCSRRSGEATFEGVARAGLGHTGYVVCLICVILTTFLAVIGYSVLLRDLLLPLATHFIDDRITKGFWGNEIMCITAGLVTPLMFMKSLTALKPMGVVGCTTIFCLAMCIAYRTSTCVDDPQYIYEDTPAPSDYPEPKDLGDYITWTGKAMDVLDSIPIFICTFVCHFNVLPVHHELHTPTRNRLRTLIHTTFTVTSLFYAFVGTVGSFVGRCPYFVNANFDVLDVQGNILNNFSDDDPIMNIGRACLSCTITLAFPLLVVPCRDMIVRLGVKLLNNDDEDLNASLLKGDALNNSSHLRSISQNSAETVKDPNKFITVAATLFVFWGGLSVACVVDDIEVVWDVLGSTISILIAFLLPSACYLVLAKVRRRPRHDLSVSAGLSEMNVCPDAAANAAGDDNTDYNTDSEYGSPMLRRPGMPGEKKTTNLRRVFAYVILFSFTPLMMVCTWNAITNLIENNS